MMKKAMVIILMVVITMISVSAVAELDYWDKKNVEWLTENTIAWLNDHGFEDYTDRMHYNDDLILGYCVLTREDCVFYDATPETIMNNVYINRAKEMLGIDIHSIEVIYYGQDGGYDIYRIITKWNDPIVTDAEFGSVPIYGVDQFVRFYN